MYIKHGREKVIITENNLFVAYYGMEYFIILANFSAHSNVEIELKILDFGISEIYNFT